MSKPNSSRDELQRSLARLHAELAATPRVDAASRRLLRDVLVDIERLLSGSSDAPTTRADVPATRTPAARATARLTVTAPARPEQALDEASPIDTAPHRLESLAVEFEARHPTLAASLRQFIDLLGRAGL